MNIIINKPTVQILVVSANHPANLCLVRGMPDIAPHILPLAFLQHQSLNDRGPFALEAEDAAIRGPHGEKRDSDPNICLVLAS